MSTKYLCIKEWKSDAHLNNSVNTQHYTKGMVCDVERIDFDEDMGSGFIIEHESKKSNFISDYDLEKCFMSLKHVIERENKINTILE